MRRLIRSAWVAFALTITAPASGAPWTEGPPLEGEPDAIRAAVAAVDAPAGANVQVLYRHTELSIDESGRLSWRSHELKRVLTTGGSAESEVAHSQWTPIREERPTIRARVLAPDGAVLTLDPATLSERPAHDSPRVHTDRRVLEAPLPGVTRGAIVETLTETREHTAPFASGRALSVPLYGHEPTERLRVSVRAPDGSGLRWRVRGDLPRGALRSDPRARDRGLVVDLQPSSLLDLWLPFAAEDHGLPVLELTTVGSWEEAAAEYAAMVELALADTAPAALEELLDGLDAVPPESLLRGVLPRIQDRIRYTSVSLGEYAYTPVSPATILARRYGDCKDLATLVVAALRARGVEAHVALVRTGPIQLDVDPGSPGLDAFDHALVHVPTLEHAWLDPTADTLSYPTLPRSVEGRLALVARPGQAELVRIPRADAAANHFREEIHVHVAANGPARVVELNRGRGQGAGQLRAWALEGRDDAEHAIWRAYGEHIYGARGGVRARFGPGEWHEEPIAIDVEVDEAWTVEADFGRVAIPLRVDGLFAALPWGLFQDLPSGTEDERRERRMWLERPVDLVLPELIRREIIHHVHVPEGMTASRAPTLPSRFEAGPVRVEVALEVTGGTCAAPARRGEGLDGCLWDGDHTVSVTFRFDTGHGRMAPADLQALHAYLMGVGKLDVPELTLAPIVELLRERNEPALSLPLAWRHAHTHLGSSVHLAHLVDDLIAHGLSDAAQRVAARAAERAGDTAAERAGDTARVWAIRAWTLLHDGLGGILGPGFDREGAVAAADRALALDPDDWLARRVRGIGLAYAEGGGLRNARADLERAVEDLRWLVERGEEEEHVLALVEVLTAVGALEEAAAVVEAQDRSPHVELHRLRLVALRDGVEAVVAELTRTHGRPAARLQAMLTVYLLLLRAHAIPEALELGHRVQSDPLAAQMEGIPFVDPERVAAARAGRREVRSPVCELAPRAMASMALPRHRVSRELVPERYAGELARLGRFRHQAPGDPGDLAGILTPEVLASLFGLVMTCDVEGDPRSGYRLRWSMGDGLDAAIYAREEEGALRFLANVDSGVPTLEALRELGRGRQAAARRWLEWALEEADRRAFLTEAMKVFGAERVADLKRAELRAALAIAAADGPDYAAAAEAMGQIDGRRLPPEAKDLLDRAMVSAQLAARSAGALPGLEDLLARDLVDEDVAWAAAFRLTMLREPDLDHAERLLTTMGATEGFAAPASFGLAMVAAERDDAEAAWSRLQRLREDGITLAAAPLGWLALVDTDRLEEGLAAIVDADLSWTAGTKAALLAALDRPTDALAALNERMLFGNRVAVDELDFLVLGRVAESYGLAELALEYYGEAMARAGEHQTSQWSQGTLARAWATRVRAPEGGDASPGSPAAPGGAR